MPTYQEILEEFERRTNQFTTKPVPAGPALPSPEAMFDEFTKRTGQRLDDDG